MYTYTNKFVFSAAIGLSVIASSITLPSFADNAVSGRSNAFSHAPLGVMGDHTHKKGEVMISYRLMHMDMQGNQIDTDSVSPEEIVTRVPNRLAGNPMQPQTLRVVPTKMSMDMNMFGLMYAPTDNVTLMIMANHINNEMNHITFKGSKGTERLGTFTTKSSGFGDTKISALVSFVDNDNHKLHFNIGVSLPTGSITEKDYVLTPMGSRPKLRLPYPMQLGSGTYDLLPGITYRGFSGQWSWGGQYLASIRTGENNENYTLGDEHNIAVWGAYAWNDALSSSLRLSYLDVGNIDGSDSKITAPVQTADPGNQGKERLDVHVGLNWLSNSGHRLALEAGTPLNQDLDGPQLETDWTVTAGYQYAF